MNDQLAWQQYQKDARGRFRPRRQHGLIKGAFQERDFVACDGEGVNRDGRHEYVLLRIGHDELCEADGSVLTSLKCLDFIARQNPDRIYCGFYFDYDVTKILQGLPVERMERIVRRELRKRKDNPGSCYPVQWQGYEIDYMKGKEFRVRYQRPYGKEVPWVVISDVGPFFQCSFVKALKAWFGWTEGKPPNEIWHGETPEFEKIVNLIAEGKDQRANFGGLDQYMHDYCKLECDMLVLLMNKFRDVCYELKLYPQEWQGPGRLVSAVLAREKYPRSKDVPLWNGPRGADIAELANGAYYGGRFEAGIIGDVPGPIYQYDINSAYPAVYRTLPCLLHGVWEQFTDTLPADGLYIADIQFGHDYANQYCGLPVRTKTGTLLFPMAGRGVYWSHEINTALPYLNRCNTFRGYRYIRTCECDPFSWVEPMYHERKKLGKSGKGIVLKLALNSTYGKLCQSVGMPTFANPIHASLITSHTRSQLYSAMMQKERGHDVIMAATDGIFTLSPRDLPCSETLGEWEKTVHPKIFVVQSGVYYVDGQIPKTRGTAVSRLIKHEQQFRDAWTEYLPQVRRWKTPKDQQICSVTVPVSNFISLSLALAWRKPELAGEWLNEPRHIAFEWFSKRTVFVGGKPVMGGGDTWLVTRPQESSAYGQSIPYAKAIGGVLDRIRNDPIEEERVMQDTQPDWSPGL